jgi:hypothetical protein
MKHITLVLLCLFSGIPSLKKGLGRGPRDYSSLSWEGFFESTDDIHTPDGNVSFGDMRARYLLI